MSKYVINDTTLTAIGDAVREKGGTTDLIPVSGLADAITNLPSGGGELPEEAFVITGESDYRFAFGGWDWFVDLYGNRITTKDLIDVNNMFRESKLTTIPFKLNFKDGFYGNMSHLFNSCTKLESIKYDITCTNTSYVEMTHLFTSCFKLTQVPYIYNAYPASVDNLFYGCWRLRELPDDYFDTWNFSRITSYQYANISGMFNYCYSLRKFPTRLFDYVTSQLASSSYYLIYYSEFANCHVLDEVVGLPVVGNNVTSNAFGDTFANTHRLKRMTFKTNEDGTPKTVNWKSQIIDLSGSGFKAQSSSTPLEAWTASTIESASTVIVGFNSGITVDKAIYNAETYNLLKNDPDAYCLANSSFNNSNYSYSRYDHNSAVETINSLPDTSAYGTNTIKFKGAAGSATDGGAISNLTDTEIAVATSKGWTVTLV